MNRDTMKNNKTMQRDRQPKRLIPLTKNSHDFISNVSKCPTCKKKGYKTTLMKNSYACEPCGMWWVGGC